MERQEGLSPTWSTDRFTKHPPILIAASLWSPEVVPWGRMELYVKKGNAQLCQTLCSVRKNGCWETTSLQESQGCAPHFAHPPTPGTERHSPGKQRLWGNAAALGLQVPTAKPCARGRGMCGLRVVVWRTVMERLEGMGVSREQCEFYWDFLGWWLFLGCESCSLSKWFPKWRK